MELYTKHRVSPPAAASTAPKALSTNILENALKETIKDLSEECRKDKRLAGVLAQEGNWKIKEDLKEKRVSAAKAARSRAEVRTKKQTIEKLRDQVNTQGEEIRAREEREREQQALLHYNKKYAIQVP